MPLIVSEPKDLTTSDDCGLKKGLKVAYYTKYSNVDWAATLADATPQFDTATQTISGFTMLNSAVWNKIDFKRQGSFYTQSYTEDADVYATQITTNFEGKSVTLRNNLVSVIRACKLVFYVIDSNRKGRLFGVDWDGVVFSITPDPFRTTQHDDNSGDFGGDAPSDVVIFGGDAEFPALYGDIDQATFESTYL